MAYPVAVTLCFSPVYSDDAPPGWAHPTAPAPALGPDHRLFYRDRVPLLCGFDIQSRKQYHSPQTLCAPLRILPLVNWEDPPKKPMMCGQFKTIHIPAPGLRSSLPQFVT